MKMLMIGAHRGDDEIRYAEALKFCKHGTPLTEEKKKTYFPF